MRCRQRLNRQWVFDDAERQRFARYGVTLAMNDRFDDGSDDNGDYAGGPGTYQSTDSGDAGDFDDVDSRAARLAAQIAARRSQQEASQSSSADDSGLPEDGWEPEPEPVEFPGSRPEAPDYTEDITEMLPT